MFEWIPRRPGGSQISNGFESGFFVTFIPAFIDEELAQRVIETYPKARSLLVSVQLLADGMQLIWNLCVTNMSGVRDFAQEASKIGEELMRVGSVERAA